MSGVSRYTDDTFVTGFFFYSIYSFPNYCFMFSVQYKRLLIHRSANTRVYVYHPIKIFLIKNLAFAIKNLECGKIFFCRRKKEKIQIPFLFGQHPKKKKKKKGN